MTTRLTRYQRYVVFAAWVGLGFDLMDSILFNFVAPIAIPDLLGMADSGSEAARAATGFWNGVLTAVMLFGWAIGGIAFGRLSDSIGRTRTVILTMLIYSLGTGACALAPNVYWLALFRVITALGIGGEWAAGATLVAETVPEERRVQMGSVLFTAPPFFVFVGIFVTWLFTKELEGIASDTSLSWRLTLGFGAVPALAALIIRRWLKEPDRWAQKSARPALRELFAGSLAKRTIGGVLIATIALLTFWIVSAFLPIVGAQLAQDVAARTDEALAPLRAGFVTTAMAWFNFGGLLGSIAAAPLALTLGRRRMYVAYFVWSAISIVLAFALPIEPDVRLMVFGLVGVSVYGIFGTFQFYLPELFPTHLRGTGAGFCLNAGRFLTVPGPFVVGLIAQSGADAIDILKWVAIIPAIGLVLLLAGVGAETRHERLA